MEFTFIGVVGVPAILVAATGAMIQMAAGSRSSRIMGRRLITVSGASAAIALGVDIIIRTPLPTL